MATQRFDANIYSDLHKDAYGFRPRMDYSVYTDEELDALWDQACDDLEREMERERQAELKAREDFEADIQLHIEHGAPSRLDAILWMFDQWCDDRAYGEITSQDVEHFFWDRGLSMELIQTNAKLLLQHVDVTY